jgi:sugar lactone lactonase YvrE
MRILACLSISCILLPAQSIISTIAGTERYFPFYPVPGTQAPLASVHSLAFDSGGTLYISDPSDSLVLQIPASGLLSVFAGRPFSRSTATTLGSPAGMAVDTAGNLYVADIYNIRRIGKDGSFRTIAGNGQNTSLGDGGPATNASTNVNGGALALDKAGNLYVVEASNHRVRVITTDGIIHAFAGTGVAGFSGDGGQATSAQLASPQAVAIDSAGNVYIADGNNARVRVVTPAGVIRTVAGNGSAGFGGDGGPATSAAMNFPSGLAFDADGNLYIADNRNNRIRKMTKDGKIATIAGNGHFGLPVDKGPAINSPVFAPRGLAFDASGNLLIAETGNNDVRSVSPDGIIQTIAGGRYIFEGDGIPATASIIAGAADIAIDQSGNIYLADTWNSRVRKVSLNGTITTFAGGGGDDAPDNVPATQASILSPQGLVFDSAGNLYISDSGHNTIRKVDTNGIITTVAGNGLGGFVGDGGRAINARLSNPGGLAMDSAGNLYIADISNNRIRKVDNKGIIQTIAGDGARLVFDGDGGPAVRASLFSPQSVAVDAGGSVYVADTYNLQVRKIRPDGTITTIAGNGLALDGGDGGLAVNTPLGRVYCVRIDAGGSLYISDSDSERIRKITPDGIITTIAGNGALGYSGDGGDPLGAQLNTPTAIALDTSGGFLFMDQTNSLVRAVRRANPTVQLSSSSLTFTALAGGTPPASQMVSVSSALNGAQFTVGAVTTDGAGWLQATPASGAAPSLLEISVDPSDLSSGSAYQGTVTVWDVSGAKALATISVTFNVNPSVPATLAIGSPALGFSLRATDRAKDELLWVSNGGAGAISVTATVDSAATWLSVTPLNTMTSAETPAYLTFTANPARMTPGVYTTSVTISSDDTQEQVQLPVTLTVLGTDPVMRLSQSGLGFQAVAGMKQSALPRSVSVLNIGGGVMSWTASATVAAGPPGWLKVTPAAGSTDSAASTVPAISVSVDPTGLTQGQYPGQVTVTAPGAANSPQTVDVVLNVGAAGSSLPVIVAPSGMIFVARAGVNPPAQQISMLNPGAQTASFHARADESSGDWLYDIPKDGILAPGASSMIDVQLYSYTDPRAGIRDGRVTIGSDLGNTAVRALLITPPTTCVAAELELVYTTLAPGFVVEAGVPVPIEVAIRDDCGGALTTGAVLATFSNGDSAVPLIALKDGRWAGTWTPTAAASNGVEITVIAQTTSTGLQSEETVSGTFISQP